MATADTTNISDLPIVRNPPTNNDEMIRNLQQSTESLQRDKESVLQSLQEEKKVRFTEETLSPALPIPETNENNSMQFVLSIEHKLIVLSVFFFLHF